MAYCYIPENIHTGNIIQTKKVIFKNIYIYVIILSIPIIYVIYSYIIHMYMHVYTHTNTKQQLMKNRPWFEREQKEVYRGFERRKEKREWFK